MADNEQYFPEKIRDWRAVFEARREAEAAAEQCRKREKELQAEIMEHMILTGQRSVGLPECTVSIKARNTGTLMEHEKACRFMYEGMKAAEAEGSPLVNHLVLQKRAAQNDMLDWAKEDLKRRGVAEDFNSIKDTLNSVGFDYQTANELSYAKRA